MPVGGKDRVLSAAEAVNAALRPLKPEERRRVLDSACLLWGVTGPRQSNQALGPPPEAIVPLADASGRTAPNPKDFMTQKQPKADVARIACLAYYLTHYRKIPKFKTQDLERLNSEARQTKIPNASVAADNATKGKAQYLTQAGGGFKQITARGEALVEALPDRERAKKALEKYPLARRFRRKKNRGRRAN